MMALKSTNREVAAKIRAYILDSIDGDNYGVELNTDKEKLQFLADTFKSEAVYPENLARHRGNIPAVFAEWCSGLPSSFNIAFTYYDIINLAKSWGTLDKGATEKQEERVTENYWNFIAVKTFQLFNKEEVQL